MTNNSKNVAVVGLGAMSYGIAVSALRGGHRVWGADISSDHVARFQAEGGQGGALTNAAGDLDAVAIVVLNTAQTNSVIFGVDGIVARLRSGAVVVACATAPSAFEREMSVRCAADGILYLDAPISGGAAKAASGKLSIVASGTPDALTVSQPFLDSIAEIVFELGGEAGTGSAMKAVNLLLAGVNIATMAEALTFGMTQGLAPEKFVEVISKCASTSWMMENRTPHIVLGDCTLLNSVIIWPKDLGIVLNIARSARFSPPITALAMRQFLAAVGMGLGQEDDAAVAKVYTRSARLALAGEDK
ncbi:NAD(P)-dependent oxidoreductase [Mameliella sediminis]|uniref:NAD(P)-dependent oxidoreductase n=1 Tax=Mameliella sediminis TaxID=2836866 RepID=UPI001C443285|nr:NAD(P)-binding domain-containing protein [Mameliella sediminis]MBV7396888.1 NAD-binding protein [Mameliella sediminis]MBY6116154.1 NAD-binding protein [Antarctobacter heliothermus]MBY6146119.1 NAD-binding protein [Mameliella alba]MCA0955304.1 NAD-binding protein [Mameliella alba]